MSLGRAERRNALGFAASLEEQDRRTDAFADYQNKLLEYR